MLEAAADLDARDGQLAAGSGLCVAHFRRAWGAAQTREQRGHLTVVQHTAAQRLAGELHEHARKQRAEAAGEPAWAGGRLLAARDLDDRRLARTRPSGERTRGR